jgi:hypothetical protein
MPKVAEIMLNKIPQSYWDEMPPKEFDRHMALNGILNVKQCARLWQVLGRKSKPPKRLQVMIWAHDVERLIKLVKAGKLELPEGVTYTPPNP